MGASNLAASTRGAGQAGCGVGKLSARIIKKEPKCLHGGYYPVVGSSILLCELIRSLAIRLPESLKGIVYSECLPSGATSAGAATYHDGVY